MNAAFLNLGRFVAVFFLLGLTAVLSGCNGSANAQAMPSLPKVNYMLAAQAEITLTTELPGRISALMVSEVRPQVGGIIKKRLFEEGADVLQGQVLYQIDPSLYEAAYNNAEAELARVEANAVAARNLANRYSKLVASGAISRQEHDDAVAAAGQANALVAAAKEALETARINLSYTKVTAPVSGRIGRSFYTPGALVTQNQPNALATIQQLDYVYVDITQSSTEYLNLQRARAEGSLKSSGKNSSKVKLLLEDGSPYAFPGENGELDWIEGELLFSDVTIDQTTGAITLRAKFKNDYSLLLPGMYVRAVIEEGVKEDAVVVPQKAIARDARGRAQAYVLTKKDPAASQTDAQTAAEAHPLGENEYYVEMRNVVIDRDYQNNWIIKSGLEPGDLLITDGLMKLYPGQRVQGVEIKADTLTDKAPERDAGVPASLNEEP
ncbi:MAG: efflux RND transporter periplasmic adaptor subunit [Desulfovibrionaceae bacterium]|nr:efflux RND transporter periplasmic adaptor subunit [Desulfovibrionaceae bacterium]